MNDFVEAQESFFHNTLGMSSGDISLDDLKSRYDDVLADTEFDRLNFILDLRLVESRRSDDQFVSMIGLNHVYTYRDSDCNLAFRFGDDKKLSFMTFITPELGDVQNVTVNGKRVNSSAKSAFAKALAEVGSRLPVGNCTLLRTYLDTYIEKGGSNLSVMDIQSYLDEMKENVQINANRVALSRNRLLMKQSRP